MLGPMQTLYVVVASASGLALGYAAASHLASNAKAALMAKLSDESSALKEAQAKLKQLKAGESKGSGKGGGGGGGKGKNKKSPDKDIKKFEKQVADANRELERLKDSQMATDKAHADALAKVEAQLASALADTAKAVEEAKEEAASAAPAEAGEVVNAELIAALGSAGASLDDILATLIQHEGQTGALLGDINGIVVAKAGDSDTVENTAAASNTLVSLPQKLQGMLPMNQHFGFELHDGENAISGQAFESEGELLALTTVGTTAPNESSLRAVVDSVKAALT